MFVFGQGFRRGDVPAGTSLQAHESAGAALPLQSEPSVTYDDGSLRFGIFAVLLPAEADTDIVLQRTSAAPAAAPALTPQVPDVRVGIRIDGRTYTATPSTAGSAQLRFAGALMHEARYRVPLNDTYLVDFDVRTQADGAVRTDVLLRVDGLKTIAQPGFRQSVTVSVGGRPVYGVDNALQSTHTVRRITVFSYHNAPVQKPRIDAVQNSRYLRAAGFLPDIDLDLGISDSAIAADAQILGSEKARPGQCGLLDCSMPSVGGRDELGILPAWTVRYLMTGDPRARDVMLLHGDLAGDIPWHFRDERTGLPPTSRDHPNMWIDDRAEPESNGHPPLSTKAPYTLWEPDSPHQPSLSYVPYLMTGDLYHLENLEAQAAYNLMVGDPGVSQSADGLRLPFAWQQAREYAWNLRTLTQLTLVLPDTHPLRAYYRTTLNRSFEHLEKHMFFDSPHWASGLLREYDVGGISIFMHDFCAVSFSWSARAGIKAAEPVLRRQANFISERLLNGHRGFPPLEAAGYALKTAPDEHQPMYPDPATLYAANLQAKNVGTRSENEPMLGYEELFPTFAQAANAGIFNATGDARAGAAYGVLMWNLAPKDAEFHEDPRFAITPRFPGRPPIRFAEMVRGSTGNDALRAPNGPLDSVVHGGPGEDTLYGSSDPHAHTMLYGGDGNDTLYAGPGGGYLFGDDGSNLLYGGAGDDVMTGGADPSGRNTFVFTGPVIGRDVITDFRPGRDRMVFRGPGMPRGWFGVHQGSYEKIESDDVADVFGHLHYDSDGNTVLDLKQAGTVTLVGVRPDALAAGDVGFGAP